MQKEKTVMQLKSTTAELPPKMQSIIFASYFLLQVCVSDSVYVYLFLKKDKDKKL